MLTSTVSTCVISLPNPMIYHLLESSRRDDSIKWSTIRFGEEIGIIGIKIHTLSGALYKSIKCFLAITFLSFYHFLFLTETYMICVNVYYAVGK